MANETKKEDLSRITLGSAQYPVRFSYAWVFEPKIDEEKIDKKTGKPKELYSMQILIPKADPAVKATIEKAIRAAADTKIAGKAIPSIWKLPLRDGDEEWEDKGEVVKGHWFLNCSSVRKPQVVGTVKHTEESIAQWELDHEHETDAFKRANRPKVGQLIRLDKEDFKSGDYGRVTVNFFYFENESKGIAVGLNNIQKLVDGEPLGNSSNADDDFGDLEDGFND